MNFGTFDRAMLQAIARAPFGSNLFTLGWMTLRMPPFSPGALITAWCRALYFKWFCRRGIERKIHEVIREARDGVTTEGLD